MAHDATGGLVGGDLAIAAQKLDLAVVRIEHPGLAELRLPPLRLHDGSDLTHRPVAVLGFPNTANPIGIDGRPEIVLPIGLGGALEVVGTLVIGSGIAARHPVHRDDWPVGTFDMTIVRNSTARDGNSGGPVMVEVAARTAAATGYAAHDAWRRADAMARRSCRSRPS
jgi:hypothetical protein